MSQTLAESTQKSKYWNKQNWISLAFAKNFFIMWAWQQKSPLHSGTTGEGEGWRKKPRERKWKTLSTNRHLSYWKRERGSQLGVELLRTTCTALSSESRWREGTAGCRQNTFRYFLSRRIFFWSFDKKNRRERKFHGCNTAKGLFHHSFYDFPSTFCSGAAKLIMRTLRCNCTLYTSNLKWKFINVVPGQFRAALWTHNEPELLELFSTASPWTRTVHPVLFDFARYRRAFIINETVKLMQLEVQTQPATFESLTWSTQSFLCTSFRATSVAASK